VKQLFIAVVLLATAAAAASAQAPQARTPAATPAATPSAGDAGSTIPATQEKPDASKIPDDDARRARPPETTDGGGAPHVPPTAGADAGRTPASAADAGGEPPKEPEEAPEPDTGFRWRPAIEQSMLFLAVQHGYALTQPKTRRELRGDFFKDYVRSVRSLRGWADGGKFFTNYVAHPMQGSLMGFVQVQNDPAGSRRRFGASGGYWRSRMKALAWSAAWSTQFEVGPLSQASLGNVGLHGKQTYVDLVMTPTAGLGLLVAEDAMDRYVIEKLERRNGSAYVRILFRMALNPTRTAANLLRFKKPWHRDPGLR
jgi:hypothetical protein